MFSHRLVLIKDIRCIHMSFDLNSLILKTAKVAKPVQSGTVGVVLQLVDSLDLKTASPLNKLHNIAQQIAGEKNPVTG